MNRFTPVLSISLVVLLAGLAGCQNTGDKGLEAKQCQGKRYQAKQCQGKQYQAKQCQDKKGCPFLQINQLVAVMSPTAGNTASGVVTFTKAQGPAGERGVNIVADIHGLTPNSTHAFHIHQYGDQRDPAGKSAGGHYNPAGHQHGKPTDDQRHAGDLGNLTADADGNAHYQRFDSNICILGKRHPILGRGVIIHAGEDQFTQPTGGAGKRISIGTIGIAKPS